MPILHVVLPKDSTFIFITAFTKARNRLRHFNQIHTPLNVKFPLSTPRGRTGGVQSIAASIL
jgi:hypothetical protein